MKNLIKHTSVVGRFVFTTLALFLFVGVLGSCGEEKENFDSRVACGDYCDKKFDCEDRAATDSESDACISACRDSIEDNCGNENQEEANNHIGECVDMACIEFWPCMTFESAPECYGFVSL